MQAFPIKPRRDVPGLDHLETVHLWFKHAPPAKGAAHWKSGRSAMEMAKAWHPGRMPSEVKVALEGTPFERFQPIEGRVEFRSYFDGPGPRNHDLVIFGEIDGEPALIDVEGKADEAFGKGTVRSVRRDATATKTARLDKLTLEMFGADAPPRTEEVSDQLLYGLYATARLAQARGCRRALFLVQVFTNETCSLRKVKKGRRELLLASRLVDSTRAAPTSKKPIIGPIQAREGASWLSASVDSSRLNLYIGRVECWQGRMRP